MSPYLSNSLILDGYHLIRFLGRGGFGEVWLCRSESMGDYRALKFIPITHGDRLEKEYDALLHYRRAAAQLRSPHLVPIEHVNRNDAGLYYVMPLADGGATVDPSDPAWVPLSLTTMIHERVEMAAWFSSREISAILLPILQGLQTLSDAGLVHRDVKPENILFFNGQPCLGDISLLGADASVITRRGTPGYATPSWYVGGHPDMYGVAATLFALLTGNSPDRMGRSAFLWPPQGETSLSPPETAEWKHLHGIIRRATDEHVSERFVDFHAMADSLTVNLPRKARSRRSLLATFAVVSIMAVAAIAAVTAFRGKPSRQGSVTSKPVTNHHDPGRSSPNSDVSEDSNTGEQPTADYSLTFGDGYLVADSIREIVDLKIYDDANPSQDRVLDISGAQVDLAVKTAGEIQEETNRPAYGKGPSDLRAILSLLDEMIAVVPQATRVPNIVLSRLLVEKELGKPVQIDKKTEDEIMDVSVRGHNPLSHAILCSNLRLLVKSGGYPSSN